MMKFVTEETENEELVIEWRAHVDDGGDVCLQCRKARGGDAWETPVWITLSDKTLHRGILFNNPAALQKNEDGRIKVVTYVEDDSQGD